MQGIVPRTAFRFLFLFFWYGYSIWHPVIQGKFDHDLKQISVYVDVEASALQFHQIPRYGKAPARFLLCVVIYHL